MRARGGLAGDVVWETASRRFLALSLAVVIRVVLPLFSIVPAHALERLEPAAGCCFGISVGEGDTIPRLVSRLGITPAVYVRFFPFPLSSEARGRLEAFFEEVRAVRGIALVTLEPFAGLAAVTEAECASFARLCATNEERGIGGILVRFAHEMNGNWYPWCQQPILFKEKFRLLSRLIHTNTSRTAMLWAPNNGIGYPFSPAGLHQAPRGSADFAALDTNGDGRLTIADDMYEPYYPGDDAVDWVGMTIYHWGANYPWLENEMPVADSFAKTLRGTMSVPPIPDFYGRYCEDGVHNKPLAIPETAAFFNTQQPAGPGELAIKRAWWQQVFNISSTNSANIAQEFPKLKCINWFDHYKRESEAQNQWIDWRISASPPVRDSFVGDLRALRHGRPYFLTALDLDCLQRADCPPLDPADAPSLTVAGRGGELVLSWPSALDRRYQLLEASDASSVLWTRVGSPVEGTGSIMEMRVWVSGTGRFFRLEISAVDN